MVIDTILHIDRYGESDPNIALALKEMAKLAADPSVADGAYVIVPDQVILHVMTKETQDVSQAQMEIHKKFMDIHLMLEGSERCGVAPLPEDVDYDEQKDIAFYDAKNDYDVLIGPGQFYMVWANEPHRPLCHAGSQKETIRKIVAKVRTRF